MDGDEEYLLLALEGRDAWLRPYVSGPCRTLAEPGFSDRSRRLKDRIARAAPIVQTAWQSLPLRITGVPHIPRSTGLVEAAGADVIHFVTQGAFITGIPSIYHPHDLQHVHLPQFFSPRVRAIRESHYKAFADQATMVAVASTWTRTDVSRHLQIPAGKVVVVPWAPPLAAVPEPTRDESIEIAGRLRLPARYLMYPARTWPHKNHAVLLDAVSLLRRRQGIEVLLVFTGHRTQEARALDARARRLGVDDLVTWTGFLEPRDLRAAYRLSEGVIIPSLFEAASAPLWETWLAGKPAACSNVTSLPEQAGNAAIIFDPHSVEAVADAIARLWTSEDSRITLARRGTERVRAFTWDRTARTFRAHYRRIAGAELSDEDRVLIAARAGI
jgi:glycosyltransferase involved in cell wall biosynthesis